MRRLRIELTQNRHAVFHLIALDLLRHDELHTVLIDLPAELAEHIRLVVLATERNDQYRSCIRMMDHVAQNLLRVLVVVSQLRTTVVMLEREDIVRACFLTQTLRATLDDTVDATDRRDDPHLIADADLTVFAAVAHKGPFLIGDVEHHLFGMILIRKQSGEVGLDIVLVHPAAGFLGLARMSNRKTVLDHVLAFSKVCDGYLMSGRHVFEDCDLLAVHLYYSACQLRLYRYNYIVGRVDFQNIRHNSELKIKN